MRPRQEGLCGARRRQRRLVGTDLGKKVSKKKETGEAAGVGSSARPQHKFTERRAAAPALPALLLFTENP